METINESKCEMSISPSLTPENIRICLIGDVVSDSATVEAAHSFGVPVITSDTGLEFVNDFDWRTYFIVGEFEGPVYEAIHKSKQCILGPPALRLAAENKDVLKHNARPVYNYSMRGVVTCFTGIRKKDELTKLVNLIHSMGGCIRKDMNSKITHLISNHSGGDKYQYAKTFRLTVIRPAWVYAAWERREEVQFRATTDEFSKEHKLRAFEGQKICFFGFPADEHQHMVDVLQSNGGIPAELDDPECSHVVMPNTGGYFLETITNTSNSPHPNSHQTCATNPNTNTNCDVDMDVDICADEHAAPISVNNKENDDNDDDNDDDDHFDARLVVDYECKRLALRTTRCQEQQEEGISPLSSDLDDEENPADLNANASTPKSMKNAPKETETEIEIDEIKLNIENKASGFKGLSNNISPIFSTAKVKENSNEAQQIVDAAVADADRDALMDTEDDVEFKAASVVSSLDLKRKRDSFDSVSLVSVDSSFALPASTKKPKLIRAGSITRSIKRSMSFVAVRTPIAKMLRPRRSSVAYDAPSAAAATADNTNDLNVTTGAAGADDSFSSIASIECTFNDSIRKPVKEKLRSIRDRITRSSSKKDKYIINLPQQLPTPKTPEKRDQELGQSASQTDAGGFKTPKAPAKLISSSCSSSMKTNTPKSYFSSPHQSASSSSKSLLRTKLDVVGASSHASASVSDSPPTLSASTATFVNINNSTTSSSATFCAHVASNQEKATSFVASIVAHAPPHPQVVDAVAVAATYPSPSLKLNTVPNANTNVAGRLNTVVDEHNTQAKPELKNNRTHILKSDWFWYTIQNGYADEMDYLFGDYLDSIANTPNTDRRDSLPISFNKRKRKRFSQRIQLEGTPLGSGKRRSSVSDAGLLSVSGSFFDCTTSPDKLESTKLLVEPEVSASEQTPAKKSMRFNHFMDFFSTESNYVGILDTIVNLFKNPLEEIAESSDALLNIAEIKAIFGNFLDIHEVHQSMLERLRVIQSKWSEDSLIGDIILQHRDDLIKAYPPYVNFFEQMKETLQHCDTQNPRFHAFLKINQTKPECGRQSLQDLMIRPVQRLPSISLLLKDILKYTNKNNPDYAKLEEALKAIKEVMMHINEDKRKTESRMAIFDIFNDIDGCPAHLVSSNRKFISKCEVTELSDNLSGRGDSLMLYLFSDTIEVCKKRSRGFNSAKSPSSNKSHKHIKLMSLNAIRFVIDITDSPRAFAMLCRQDKDKLHSFTLADEEVDKVLYLKTLCKQMAEHACRTDTDKALLCRTSQELEVDISDVNLSTLSKAFKLAARTRLKVGRAFSFNKTPSKLKRAVSTMMTSPFGSTNSLTPASQLAQMRLASCTNIHEAADEDGNCSSSPSTQSEGLSAPLSVQLSRKNKSSTMSGVGRI